MRLGVCLACSLALAASGCATLSQEECLRGDWHGIGEQDGARGRKEDYLARHAEACAEYRISPNSTAYFQGRAEGLKSYCTSGRGYGVGREGTPYDNICPPALEKQFLMGYAAGLGEALRKTQGDLQASRRELDRKERESYSAQGDKQKKLDSEVGFLRSEVSRLEHRQRDIEALYGHYRGNDPTNWKEYAKSQAMEWALDQGLDLLFGK